MGQRYRRMEDLKSLPIGTQPGFYNGRALKRIGLVEKCKYLIWERVEKACVTQTYHRRGSGGRTPSRRRLWGFEGKTPSSGRFFLIFWKKKAILMPLNHILHVFRAI